MHRSSSTPDPDKAHSTESLAHEHVHIHRHGGEDSCWRSICINIDDFGLHAGINRAASHLVDQGRAHAISCMVGGPAWLAGRWTLQTMRCRGVDIGLHLDLTEHPLLTPAWRHLPSLWAACYGRTLDRSGMQREIQAQLNRFEQDTGHAPAFIDGHQHIHQLPQIRAALLDELQARYGDKGPWLRSTRPAPGMLWRHGMVASSLKSNVIDTLGRRGLSCLARQQGYAQNRHLLGAYDFQGGPTRYHALLTHWLTGAQEGDLLMCHPGLTPNATDAISKARAAEFDILSGGDFGTLLTQARIRLEPMSQILARQAGHLARVD